MKAKQFPYSTVGVLLIAIIMVFMNSSESAIILLVFFGIYRLLK